VRARPVVYDVRAETEEAEMATHAQLLTALVTIAAVLLPAAAAQETVEVSPGEIDDLLANPHMGWETFYRPASRDENLQGLPSSVDYIRWYWDDLEPERGAIDYAMIDRELQEAHECGQQVAFRVMVYGSGRRDRFCPEWLEESGCPGFRYEYHREGGTRHWGPDFNDPDALAIHLSLIRRLGERYDGHPDIVNVDIGSVGLWGEWHMSGTDYEIPEPHVCREIIDTYFEAFPKTQLIMLIGPAEHLKYATSKGAGWRADCLGDLGMFSDSWSHMRNAYPERLALPGIAEVWKSAPVAFETCGDMRSWVQRGYDVDGIYDWALDVHASYINNKSAPIPEGTRPSIEKMLRRLGYRFVLRRLAHSAQVAPGGELKVDMDWENVGVAPCYADYSAAVSLVSAAGKRAWTGVVDSNTRKWLPGPVGLGAAFTLPADLPPGQYSLEVGVVDPESVEPVVKLAIDGLQPSGWYRVSNVTVRR
jgi:hypothetical protein